MITGDHSSTASSIAKMVGIKNHENVLLGVDIIKLGEDELVKKVREVNIFARVFPEAKLRIVEAFKKSGEIVAMTGDGVNDAPALKAAHIGVAMGRGSAVAHAAAGLVLPDDNLSLMTEAILLGRKIYTNLRNAFRYIISIHIPVILLVAVPILLSWDVTHIFLPIHVIFLELIMGPTCSIIYENEPAAKNVMLQPPRKRNEFLFSWKELSVSIIQGLMIAFVCLTICYLYIEDGHSPEKIRTITYTTLIWCNIFLTLENRSFQLPIYKSILLYNPLMPLILAISLLILCLSVYLIPVQTWFGFTLLTTSEFLECILWAAAGVFWIEVFKIAMPNKPVAH
jgi:Ca2+-transporting ATPase